MMNESTIDRKPNKEKGWLTLEDVEKILDITK